MIVRGLIIAASGFIFIFAPGVPIALIRQRILAQGRSVLSWGIIVGLIATFQALFIQNLVEPIFIGEAEVIVPTRIEEYIVLFGGTILTAIMIAGWLYFALLYQPSTPRGWISFILLGLIFWWVYLLFRRNDQDVKVPLMEGLSIGFGSALLAQVFKGMILVTAGFRLLFGGTGDAILNDLANAPFVDLVAGLLALILSRVAILVVGGIVGVLVARAVSGERRPFVLAIIVTILFDLVLAAITLLLSGETLEQLVTGGAGGVGLRTSVVSILYYALVFIFGYQWLVRRKESEGGAI